VPAVEGVGTTGSGGAHYAIATDGNLIYVSGSEATNLGLRTMVWVDRQGRETAVNAPPRAFTYARLSPDGTRVALDARDQQNDSAGRCPAGGVKLHGLQSAGAGKHQVSCPRKLWIGSTWNERRDTPVGHRYHCNLRAFHTASPIREDYAFSIGQYFGPEVIYLAFSCIDFSQRLGFPAGRLHATQPIARCRWLRLGAELLSPHRDSACCRARDKLHPSRRIPGGRGSRNVPGEFQSCDSS
jgi:hypothetical protein